MVLQGVVQAEDQGNLASHLDLAAREELPIGAEWLDWSPSGRVEEHVLSCQQYQVILNSDRDADAPRTCMEALRQVTHTICCLLAVPLSYRSGYHSCHLCVT